jgi:hypothetical protein
MSMMWKSTLHVAPVLTVLIAMSTIGVCAGELRIELAISPVGSPSGPDVIGVVYNETNENRIVRVSTWVD